MKIENIETADCTVKEIIKNNKSISIRFDKIYCLTEKKYKSNITLIIENWTKFLIKLYVTQKPFTEPEEFILNINKFESFDLIQEIDYNVSKLILKGFSKESGNWMVYEFNEYDYKIMENE